MPESNGFAASLKAVQDAWREAEEQWERETAAKVSVMDEDARLRVVRDTLHSVYEHMREGGSYRYLIYDRLGFDAGAYALLLNDGMAVSNWICDAHHPYLRDWWGITKRFAAGRGSYWLRRAKWRIRAWWKAVEERLETVAVKAALRGDAPWEA